MNSDKYVEWCIVSNTVSSRLKDNSLFHTVTREKRIRKSTKLINQTFERKVGKKTYAQFRQCKQKILKQLTENIDVFDKSGFSDTYYKSYYDSFDTSITNLNADDFLWHNVDKKGRDQDKPEDSSEEPFYFWEPDININVIKTNKDFENTHDISKIRKQVQTIDNKNSTKKEATPKNLVKSENTTINSTSISNKEVSSVNRKVTLKKSASVKQSPKSKQVNNKRSKDVKKNLTAALDNVSLRSQEFDVDEWNDEFAAAEFQAQSTQIFSDTFTDNKAKIKPSVDHKLSHEVTNQPRDSGIEEDSREDNTKFENLVNGKKYRKNEEHHENHESETFKEKNMNNLKDVDNNLHQNEVKKSPCKKVPLKIIGEEKVTQKFKIITNKDQELKPEEKEKEVELSKTESSGSSGIKVNPTNEKSGSSSESDSEFADCHNADDSQYNKSDQDSSDEYYDIQDNGSEGEFEDSQNENKNENDLQNDNREGDSENSENENKIENDSQNDDREADSEDSQNKHENEKAESDNSSTNESIIRKRKLKERLKRCKSPYMIMRYNRLKKSGVLEESDIETQTKLIKNSEKKKPKKTLITPSKSSETKKTSQLKAARLLDTPKTQKQVNNNESFEEKTLVAENCNDDSVSINELKESVENIDDNMEEATPNVAKLQQGKRLSLLADNDESEDSEGENTHKKAKDKAKRKNNTESSNNKHCQQQMKRLHPVNSSQDFDENESGCENNEANETARSSNTSGTKEEKTDSSKIKNVQNLSKCKKDNSDSTVSETSNSQSSSESEQCNKKKDKIQMHKRLPDKETLSAREVSVEISTQSDLKNVVNHYKETLLSQTSQVSVDLAESNEPSLIIGTQFQPIESPVHEDSDDSESSEEEKTVIKGKNQNEMQEKESISVSAKKDDSLNNESHKINKIKQKAKTLKESSSEEDASDLEDMRIDSFNTNVNKNEDHEDEWIMSSKSKENLNKFKRLDLFNNDEDSDDSEDDIVKKSHCNSDVDIEKRKTESILSHDDSQKKVSLNPLKSVDCDSSDNSESELPSVCKTNKSKSKPLSSKFTSINDSGAEPDIDDKSSNISKNKSPHKRKFAQIHCVDSQTKVSLNQLKSTDCDSSDNSESELPSVCKTNKSKSKPLSSKFASINDSGAEPDIDDKSSNISKNKSPYKRKFTQINSVDANDTESGTSQEIDVVHYSSENDVNDKKKIKKSKCSNFDANVLAEEGNIDSLSANSIKHTKLNTVLSENESDDSGSDQAMSYSSKQKIMRLKKINLLASNNSSSSSSSEDEETIESSQNKWQNDHKKGAASKNSAFNDPNSSDSNSDSEKKKELHKFDAKVNKKQNQVKENEDLDEEDDKSSFKDQKDDIFADKNSNCEDSEEECTMSSKTKERLNKMKRLDLFNSNNDSDDSKESSEYKNDCNSDVDIEEHKIEDIVTQHDLKKNNETLKNQISLNDFDSEKNKSPKSKTKTKSSIKDMCISEIAKNSKITSNKSSKLTSTLVPNGATDCTQGDAFEKEKDGSKESKKSKKKDIIQETQESAHSEENILESQPMFSSLEDLREGIDENQLNFEVDSDVNANSIKDVSKISLTQAPTKTFTDKITKISELVEKESLEKITCQSTMNVNSISPDEDIFVLEVPKSIFKENLIGKKFSFSKRTLTVGSNNYEAFQKHVSPTYSCILKTEKKALDSFTTQNIRPVATIIARRKKFMDESAKASDNEIEENHHEFSCDNEIKNLSNGNSLKDKSPKMKVAKKVAKRTKKSEEKEVQPSSVKSNKKETVTSMDESAKASDNEIEENHHEFSCDNEIKNLSNGNSLKDKSPKMKVVKKVSKRTKKSEEKEVQQSSVKSNKKETVTSMDESAKAFNNEIEENHEFSCDNEIKNLSNGDSLKDKSPKMKVAKKVAKRTKKSEEKEVRQSFVKSNKKETVTSKKIKSTKNIFDIKNFIKKTPTASTTDSPKKRIKKLQRKMHTHTDEALTNDEIANGENLDNNNLSSFPDEACTQIAENKTEKTNEAVNISMSKDNILKKPVKSPGKVKKIKAPAENIKESKDAKVSEKKKSTEPVKKLAKSESKPLAKKRKAENQLSGDANSAENQETRKKKKVTTEKKEKKPTNKAAKPRNSKKKAVSESGESAADQIRKLIAKNIKFDDSLNSSFDPSNYNPLNVERIPKKPKRCQSTTSSSSDDDGKYKRSSFHVRVKSKSENDKSTGAFSDDVKKEEKKTVKKIFFAE